MNTTPGQELNSNFYMILTDTNGLSGIPQMPAGGPWVTDPGYQVSVDGRTITGRQVRDALAEWLTHGFPK